MIPRESSGPQDAIDAAPETRHAGSQAIKALKEEGIEVVLINPNIATVQTSREDASSVDVERHKSEPIADHVYLLPVTADNVRHILDKEKNIDGAWLSVFTLVARPLSRESIAAPPSGPKRLEIAPETTQRRL